MAKSIHWFWLAVVAALLAAPNATIIRVAVDDADPLYWTISRFTLIALVCLPFVLRAGKALRNAAARRELIKASVALAVAMLSYVFAIYYSQASYVSIVTLLTPILFVVFSTKLIGEKINSRAIAGITLAAFGAMVLVVLPVAIQHDGTVFYPLATGLALINCIAYALSTVYLRKADEAGVTAPVAIGISSALIALVAAALFVLFGDWTRMPTDGNYLAAVAYSALVVALLVRAFNVLVYERLGSAVVSALTYLQIFAAILIPVVVLHEQLSPAMVIGGALILLGVYVVEVHKHPHIKHHLIHHNH